MTASRLEVRRREKDHLTLDDEQRGRDDAGDVIAGDAFIDAFIFPAQLDHRQIAHLHQCPRARREARIYLLHHHTISNKTRSPSIFAS